MKRRRQSGQALNGYLLCLGLLALALLVLLHLLAPQISRLLSALGGGKP